MSPSQVSADREYLSNADHCISDTDGKPVRASLCSQGFHLLEGEMKAE